MDRRDFLKTAAISGAAGLAGLPLGAADGAPGPAAVPSVKPKRLSPGDTVALVSPSGATATRNDAAIVKENMEALGFKVKPGPHLLDRYGYLGGQDADRAADLMAAFADPEVDGIVAMKGGWGCARVLPLLDYDVIRRNPKVLVGYSDITALLVGLHAKTGLVTFHGPIGLDPWNGFTVNFFRRVVMEAEPATFRNLAEVGDHLTQVEYRVQTIVPGTATGVLRGGNLSIISSLIGTEFVPGWSDAILFVEDINEADLPGGQDDDPSRPGRGPQTGEGVHLRPVHRLRSRRGLRVADPRAGVGRPRQAAGYPCLERRDVRPPADEVHDARGDTGAGGCGEGDDRAPRARGPLKLYL